MKKMIFISAAVFAVLLFASCDFNFSLEVPSQKAELKVKNLMYSSTSLSEFCLDADRGAATPRTNMLSSNLSSGSSLTIKEIPTGMYKMAFKVAGQSTLNPCTRNGFDSFLFEDGYAYTITFTETSAQYNWVLTSSARSAEALASGSIEKSSLSE